MEITQKEYEIELDNMSDEFGFKSQLAIAFRNLMTKRFKTKDLKYAREWAVRFDCESAYAHSDNETKAFLNKFGLEKEISPSGTVDDHWVEIDQDTLNTIDASLTEKKTYKVLLDMTAYNKEDLDEQLDSLDSYEIEWWCQCNE